MEREAAPLSCVALAVRHTAAGVDATLGLSMSQPPEQETEQPPLENALSFASVTSDAGSSATPDNNTLSSPQPRTPGNLLTPSLPISTPSPLAYSTSQVDAASPAFSINDSIYSPRPHSTSFSSPAAPTATPPLHSLPSHAIAQSAHHRLAAVLTGVHALLSSYQQLSAVDSAGLQAAVAQREASDEADQQLAATIRTQQHQIDTALAALHTAVQTLQSRHTQHKAGEGSEASEEGGGEDRRSALLARRDRLLQLVRDGNADVLALVARLRGLQRMLGLFAYESDMELRIVPNGNGLSAQQSAGSGRR